MKIGIVRTSTIKQDIEAQTIELKQFMIADGCKEEEIIIVDGHGASAIKMDDLFRENVEKVKSYIEQGNVDCVYAWQIDRLGRNDEFLMGFKNYLISKKVQLKIQNPRLELLNDDGTVNAGMELAFFLFTALAKQEMEGKKARFKRGREHWAEQGKYMGGEYVRFGYYVDDNGFFQIDEKKADAVRLAFKMYATGNYSMKTLSKELEERGYEYVSNCGNVSRLLRQRAYLGEPLKGKLKLTYPRIISDELFEKVQAVLSANNLNADKQVKHHYFGNKILKCPYCGGNMTSNGKDYICFKSNFSASDCKKMASRVDFVDGLLYQIAVNEHLLFLARNSDLEAERLQNELRINSEKKNALVAAGEAVQGKIERAKLLFKKGLSSEHELDADITKIKIEDDARKNKLLELTEKEKAINAQIKALGVDEYDELLNMWDKVLEEKDEAEISKMIKTHVKKALIVKKAYNLKEITITLVDDRELNFIYKPFNKRGQRLFKIEDGKEIQYLEHYIKRAN